MAAPVLLTSFAVLFFVALATTTTASASATTKITKLPKLSAKLIRRDSVLSPHYDPNSATRALKSSVARLAYLQSRANTFSTDSVRTNVLAEETGAQFMANFSFGEPPVPQLLTMDTASNLLWMQCLPCTKCFEQFSPVFDPAKSSTYKNLPCHSPSCTVSLSDKCDASNNCKFSQGYLDGTRAKVILGSETISFTTEDEGIAPVPDVLFGCAHDNEGFNGQPSGILGLGPDKISLVNKLGSKFSYCFGNIRDSKYENNQLILGDGSNTEGASTSTPLQVFNSLYYVNMEGISVGENRLNIDPGTFTRTQSGSGGVVIDSGTTVTFLVSAAYQALKAEVTGLTRNLLEIVQNPDDQSLLCFKGVISRDLTGFPVVTFHFSGGAELGLDAESMFQENGADEFCMAVHESDLNNNLNVIGVMAQQGYNVGFDLAGKKVSFERIDCQLLA